ncbi:MAG TPA: prepilin-type N-terminal cleavage/methylation domain-containing protein [Roseimicrobium sp.]|nr:prepilin-type N-terminal cleavage/methylation domain-containing protein [Roseimicrobium sp.]
MSSDAFQASCRKSNRHCRGFTLIELLVVLTLLALLLSIAVPRYLGTMQTGREKVRAQNMATVRDAIDKFHADQGRYPSELVELVSKRYLRTLPQDPVTESTSWTPLSHPAAAEPGVYDIAPPGAAPGSSTPTDQYGQPPGQTTP